MWRAYTSDGPTLRNTSRYSSATVVIASPGDAAASTWWIPNSPSRGRREYELPFIEWR